MDIEQKIELVKRKPTEEIVTEQDLREIFEAYSHPKHYIGFEISGMVHLGSGLCIGLKIKDLLAAGCKPMIWLADYHSWVNDKLGGDLEKIRAVANGYFKHAFISLGLTEDKVDYALATDHYDADYWKDVVKIMRDTTLNRMLRCITIMGRKETDSISAGTALYPALQVADIFLLDVQIAHAGMDQRKAHMLARELAPKFRKKFVALHTHLLPGLIGSSRMNQEDTKTGADDDTDVKIEQEAEVKMSKSKPSSAIFIHDSEAEIDDKIKKAFCPEKVCEGNPIYEIAEYLILRDRSMKIERPAKFGGDIEVVDSTELAKIYQEGKLHPMDLKRAVVRELVVMLKPSREYFEKNKEYLAQLKKGD